MTQLACSISMGAIATASEACRTAAGTITIRSWHEWIVPLFDPYRPELHYMRGPGPKWHEKHESRNV